MVMNRIFVVLLTFFDDGVRGIVTEISLRTGGGGGGGGGKGGGGVMSGIGGGHDGGGAVGDCGVSVVVNGVFLLSVRDVGDIIGGIMGARRVRVCFHRRSIIDCSDG